MRHLISYLIIVVAICGCTHPASTPDKTYIPPRPNYHDKTLWYIHDKGKKADVFYVTPTCIFDWTEPKNGQPCHHYDVYDETMKENFDYSLQLADDIFGQECNFYAPYYRQISLESWLLNEDTINNRFKIAMNDVNDAFEYYMEHDNRGNDFVLAGFSQGAKAVVELTKNLNADELAKMKAAYVIGYKIVEEDLENGNIHLATDECGQGVVICYNSVETVADMWPAVSAGNMACINPVNWTTDATPAHLNDTLTVQVDTAHKLLLVNGYHNTTRIPALDGHVSHNNYHLSELTLYQDCLKENVVKRIRPFQPN